MNRRNTRSSSSAARGFTLIEALIAIAVLAVLVAMAVPRFTPDDRQRLNAAAMVLASDIEFAQLMTIANPQDPLAVRFDANGIRYWIAYARSPNDPIDRPDSNQPYVVVLGNGRAATAAGIEFAVFGMNARTLEFESHGGLADFTSTPSVVLTVQGSSYPRIVVNIAPTTGTITAAYEPRSP